MRGSPDNQGRRSRWRTLSWTLRAPALHLLSWSMAEDAHQHCQKPLVLGGPSIVQGRVKMLKRGDINGGAPAPVPAETPKVYTMIGRPFATAHGQEVATAGYAGWLEEL